MTSISSPKGLKRVPVSRTSFALSDRTALDGAIDFSLNWISKTARCNLPPEASGRQPFAIDEPEGRASVSVTRLDDSEGSIWAARLSNFADPTPDRTWITDIFVEQRAGSFARFGAQLTCEVGPNDPGFEHSRPRLVKEIIDNLAAEADDEALTNHFQTVSVNEVEQLSELIYRGNRRLPVLVVSTDNNGGAQVDLDRLSNRLSGACHLRAIAVEESFELSRTIGSRMSAFNGAVRLYNPGLTHDNENPFEHPLWLAPRTGRNLRAAHQIAQRILSLGYRDSDGDARFWRVGLLRQAMSRAAADAVIGTGEASLSAEISALQVERDNAVEAAKSAESLMEDASQKLNFVQADVERLAEENYNLRNRLSYNESNNDSGSSPLSPDDVRELIDQQPTLETSLRIVASLFPDRIEVLSSAYSSARDSFGFNHRRRAFDLIWSLVTDYWSALSQGESDATARKFLGAAYAAKESGKLSTDGVKRRTFAYNEESIEMMKHLKIGVKDSKSETLRIHFEWLARERKIVVGHCGGHLDF